jgi:GAF domain-containing protein
LSDYVLQTGQTTGIGDVRLGAPMDVSGMLLHGLYVYAGAPLVYQETRIGTISFFGCTVRDLRARELALLEAIGAQIGVGVATAQLFEEAQLHARQERLLREITTRVRGFTDPDAIMRAAVRELGTALDRPAFVRLGIENATSGKRAALADGGGKGNGASSEGGG